MNVSAKSRISFIHSNLISLLFPWLIEFYLAGEFVCSWDNDQAANKCNGKHG